MIRSFVSNFSSFRDIEIDNAKIINYTRISFWIGIWFLYSFTNIIYNNKYFVNFVK